jgi:Cof subfamily protein (haloacid dehalogenase superfamily)
MMKHMKGLIALDIDGTITPDLLKIPDEVVSYLENLTHDGWVICLITGRSFHFAEPAIKQLRFPFYLALLNGALMLEMPQRHIVKQHYIEMKSLPQLDKISENEPTDFVIYSGYENGDVCYYRPHRFSTEMLRYVEGRAAAYREVWKAVDDFGLLGIESFPSIKCIGTKEVIERMSSRAMEEFDIAMPVIRDPWRVGYYVGLGTHAGINKGKAILDLKEILSLSRVIAAGDDFNDLPMLQVADISIVMESAPLEMHAHADILAKPATQNGIIDALGRAIFKERFNDRNDKTI